ncbi:MAG: hypothetical protein XU10_C0011G0048 [Chloroflexi bacterium CSP1-4]|nr:MAG: hypothetical protein XU10_C0011G0048 [Chloroflexi bacterium CSP1-4]
MALFPRPAAVAALPSCLRCGLDAPRPEATFCRRCGLPFGAEPAPLDDLPACPVCYQEPDPDGRHPSAADRIRRLAPADHRREHERHPVGDDEWLESLREGDRIRIGRWKAPYGLVRRYLVTGIVSAGRRRQMEHDTIVTAMTQLARWGAGVEVFGDQPEWASARQAVASLMERYHRA